MDHDLLLIFLLASCWLYATLLLALRDWRWNLGRIIQYGLCAAFGAWLVLTGRPEQGWTLVVTLLFTATVLLPFMLQQHIRGLLLKGRARTARFWQFLACLLTWRSPSAIMGALARAQAAIERAAAPSVKGRLSGRLLAGICLATSRRTFLASRIDAFLSVREYRAAADLFERHVGEKGLEPDAALLYTMVVPFSELGDVRRATAALRRAEERREYTSPYDMRRLMATIRVYALCGRPHEIQRVFEEEKDLTALLPPAYPYLWGGAALLNAGEKVAAQEALTEALARVRPGEDRIREMIERYLWAPPDDSGPVTLSAETLADLEATGRLREYPRAAPVPSWGRPARVTWLFIAASVLVWLMTEWFGSSMDARTLVRFGANVPTLVTHGEWWRLVSSIFLHVGWLHLFFNSYACYLFGNFVERATGRWSVFVVFMFSGVVGSAVSALLGAHVVSAGASGAVFGLLGTATAIALRFRGSFPTEMRRMYIFSFLFIAAMEMVFGLVETRIDNLAHGGGFAAGLLVGLFVAPGSGGKLRRRAFQVASLMLAALPILAGIAAVRNVRAGGYPLRIPPLNDYIADHGEWKVSVPALWEQVPKRPGQLVFLDPLSEHAGAALTITSRPARRLTVPRKPDEGVVQSFRRVVGGREYLETVAWLTRGDPPVVRFLFQTVAHGRVYALIFECDASDMPAYRERIIEPILRGFEIAGGKNEKGKSQQVNIQYRAPNVEFSERCTTAVPPQTWLFDIEYSTLGISASERPASARGHFKPYLSSLR